MSRRLTMLCACLMLSAMSGCATALTGPRAVSDYCLIAKPIPYDSTTDSADTVKEVEAHNSRWVCVCEGDCPKGSGSAVGA